MGIILFVATFFLVLIVGNSISGVRAQETVIVNSSQPTVTVDYRISFHENVSGLSNGNVVLDSSNSTESQVLDPIQAAIQKLDPSAIVDPASFKLAMSVKQQGVNSTMWIMNENFTIQVSRVASSKLGTTSVDLTFLRMNVSDPLKFGGLEYNNIGPTYLLGPINSQQKSTTFYLDRALIRGGPYLNPVIPGLTTQSFSLLDFSWIPKVSEWTHTYSALDAPSSWTIRPGSDRPGLPYNLTMGIKSPEGTLLATRVAFYNLGLSITAPARAVAEGFTIYFPISSSTDFVMPTIVGATVVVAVGSFVAEKTLVKPLGQYKKKRKN